MHCYDSCLHRQPFLVFFLYFSPQKMDPNKMEWLLPFHVANIVWDLRAWTILKILHSNNILVVSCLLVCQSLRDGYWSLQVQKRTHSSFLLALAIFASCILTFLLLQVKVCCIFLENRVLFNLSKLPSLFLIIFLAMKLVLPETHMATPAS